MLWFEGRLHATTIVPFDVTDRGLLLGDGVFDTSLVLGGRMVWRDAHLARLAAACETLGFPLDRDEAARAIDALTGARRDGALRITVTRGVGPRGLVPPEPPRPMLLAAIAPPPESFFKPLSLQVSAISRNETSPTSRLKMLSYSDAILAGRAARDAGFDDALFCNSRGHVACTSLGNIVVLAGDALVTPPLGDGVLPGIVRAALLRVAPSLGLSPLQRSLTIADLQEAGSVFVSNSLRLLSPVTRLDARTWDAGSRRASELAEALAYAVNADCGVDPRFGRRAGG